MKIQFPAVYPITDIELSGLSLAEQVEQMAAGGAKLIQIRDKRSSSRDLYNEAAEAIRFSEALDVRIIINDRVDIAMLLNADGVHLGQEDLSPIHARRLLGENAIIGYSTHTLAQAAAAARLPIDYLAFGPIFQTSTKENPDPVVGLDLLADVKRIAGHLPLIAIGGIDESNIGSVLDAGADSAAIIGGIVTGPKEIAAKVRSLLSVSSSRENKNV